MSFLRIQDLHALRHMRFAPRKVIHGMYAGLHDSPQRGHSVEFNDYRAYSPGDDVATIDWKVLGRSDRLVVKLFEHQTDLQVSLLIDGSASMTFRGFTREPPPTPLQRARLARRRRSPVGALSKYQQACMLGAAIAFLVIKQQDRIAYGRMVNGLETYLPPRATFPHLQEMLHEMERPRESAPAGLCDSLDALRVRSRRRGLLIVLSDFLDEEQECMRLLNGFRRHGWEVILFHVLHEHELKLPDLGAVRLIDSETDTAIRIQDRAARLAYEANLARFLEAWRTGCRYHGMDYNLVSTAEPYHRVLGDYLYGRTRLP